MSVILAGMVFLSCLFGLINGRMAEVSAAVLDGAGSAVELCLSMAGTLCLWSGVMEVLQACGIRLSGLFLPLIRRLMPRAAKDPETLEAISGNLSANLLGLGNAATPLGIRAATRMAKDCHGIAGNELCLLVVLNTASIQLLPVTVAAIRSAAGCDTPFDILPAVWVTSLLSVSAGLLAAAVLSRCPRYRHEHP